MLGQVMDRSMPGFRRSPALWRGALILLAALALVGSTWIHEALNHCGEASSDDGGGCQICLAQGAHIAPAADPPAMPPPEAGGVHLAAAAVAAAPDIRSHAARGPPASS